MQSLMLAMKYSVNPMPSKPLPVIRCIRTGVTCTALYMLVFLFPSLAFAGVGIETTAVDSVDWSRITWDIEPYAVDRTDGGGKIRRAPEDSTIFQFDDAARHNFVVNAQWRVRVYHDESQIHVEITPLGSISRPSNTLHIGAKVILHGTVFYDGEPTLILVTPFNPDARDASECVRGVKPNVTLAEELARQMPGGYTPVRADYKSRAMLKFPQPTPRLRPTWRWEIGSIGIAQLMNEGAIAHYSLGTVSVYPVLHTRTPSLDRWFLGGTAWEGYSFFGVDKEFALLPENAPFRNVDTLGHPVGGEHWFDKDTLTLQSPVYSILPFWLGYNMWSTKSLQLDLQLKYHPLLSYNFRRKNKTSSDPNSASWQSIYGSAIEANLSLSSWFPLHGTENGGTLLISLSYFHDMTDKRNVMIPGDVGSGRTWPKLDGLSLRLSFDFAYLSYRVAMPPGRMERWNSQVREEALRMEQADSKSCEMVFSSGPSLDESYGLLENGILDAMERVALPFEVTNHGPGPAFSPALVVSVTPSSIQGKNPSFAQERLEPGEKRSGKVNLEIPKDIEDGNAVVSFQITEARGYHSAEKKLTIRTAKLIPCDLKLADFKWLDGETGTARGNGDGIVQNGETIECQAFIRNDGKGPATVCNATLRSSDSDVLLDHPLSDLGTVLPGQTATAKFTVTVGRDFDGRQITLELTTNEARTTGAALSETKTIPVEKISTDLTVTLRPEEGLSNGATTSFDVTVKNRGQLAAQNVTVTLRIDDATVNPSSLSFAEIKAGSDAKGTIQITIPPAFDESYMKVGYKIEERGNPKGSGSDTFAVAVTAPRILISGQSSAGSAMGYNRETEWTYLLRNTGKRSAEDVRVRIHAMKGGPVSETSKTDAIGRLPAGETCEGKVMLKAIPLGAKDGKPLDVEVTISMKDFPDVRQSIPMELIENPAELDTIIAQMQETALLNAPGGVRAGGRISLARAGIIDLSLPESESPANSKAYALVIGNQEYTNVPHVVSAGEDARQVFYYLQRVFGVPPENFIGGQMHNNLTLARLRKQVNSIKIAVRNPRDSELYIFYSGHGYPIKQDPESDMREGSLVGTDFEIDDPASYVYRVQDLIGELASLQFKKVVIFLDACFSGRTTDQKKPLVPGRPIGIGVSLQSVPQNFTVFSAADSSQVAYDDPNQGNGIFTEVLLFGLKGAADADRNGLITNGEMRDYLSFEVPRLSREKCGDEQTPVFQGAEDETLARPPQSAR